MNKKIAEEVLERSEGLCEVCYMQGIELHHIIFGSSRKACERVESVILLCMECHRGTKGVHGKDGRALDLKLKKQLEKTYREQGRDEDEIRYLLGGRYYIGVD